jgi:hypothetical protein
VLIIRHTSGPLAGKEQRIDPKSDRITFGRDPNACDVVYPPDATLISRRHFALVRKPSGEWTFDLFGDPYVGVNGEPADPSEAVHSGDKIELGKPGGPSFDIVLEGEALAGGLPVTEGGYRAPGAHAVADHADRAASRARRVALGGVLLAILVAAGAGGLWYSSRLDVARLTDETRRLQQDAAAQTIGQPVRDKLIRAAYFVVARDANGTAYSSASATPIALDMLGTNAHVAAMFEDLPAGASLFVRSPGAEGKEYKVISATMHPGFKTFIGYMAQDPFFLARRLDPFPAYDVGLLRVAEGTNLGPILELATQEELADLKSGFPLAMAGYPAEAITGGAVQSIAATPTFAAGMISSITDMFQLPGDAAHSHMIHHNLPSAGGASGSPMVGPNGKIYAFNNAGESFSVPGQPGRIPSGALQNYGQRVDLIRDLIDGKAAAVVEADRAYWQQKTAGLRRGVEVVVEQQVRAATATLFKAGELPENLAPILVSQQKVALTEADRFKDTTREFDKSGAVVSKEVTKRQKMFPVKLTAGKPMAFIVYAENMTKVELWLYNGKQSLRNDQGSHFSAVVPYKAATDMEAEVYVTAPDENTNLTFFVYGWGAPPS